MGQKSAVDKLPEPLRKRLIELLNRPDVTQLEIVEAINAEAGEPLISKSSLNRYALRMKKFAEKPASSRGCGSLLEKYGSDTRNKLGKVVNEQIRLIAFDLICELEELKESKHVSPALMTDVIFKVSRGLKELNTLKSSMPSGKMPSKNSSSKRQPQRLKRLGRKRRE